MFEEEIKRKAKERKSKTTLAWRRKNWQHCLEMQRKWSRENREKIREREMQPDRVEYRRNWQQKNKEKLRVYHREYYHRKLKERPEDKEIRKKIQKIITKMEGKNEL